MKINCLIHFIANSMALPVLNLTNDIKFDPSQLTKGQQNEQLNSSTLSIDTQSTKVSIDDDDPQQLNPGILESNSPPSIVTNMADLEQSGRTRSHRRLNAVVPEYYGMIDDDVKEWLRFYQRIVFKLD
jgi:hypothetical protein